ncbi:MAG: HDIG domain-containing protein [Magnetococcus sp. DMHC-1]|nr:HDIG domain-containing protein [Magnetococcales bacterium]
MANGRKINGPRSIPGMTPAGGHVPIDKWFVNLIRLRNPRLRAILTWLRVSPMVDFILFGGLVGLLTMIYSPMVFKPLYLPEVGEFSRIDVKADRDILIEDTGSTLRRQDEAALTVAPVYDWDDGMMDLVINYLRESLTWLGESMRNGHGANNEETIPSRELFSQRMGETISVHAYRALLAAAQFPPPVAPVHSPPQPAQPAADTATHAPVPSVLPKLIPREVAKQAPAQGTVYPSEDPEEGEVNITPNQKNDLDPERKELPTRVTSQIDRKEPPAKSSSAAMLPHPYADLIRIIENWLVPLANQRVVSGPEVLRDLEKGPYVRRSISRGTEQKLNDVNGLTDLDGMRQLLLRSAAENLGELPKVLQDWLLNETRAQIRPNFVLNLAETKLRRQRARDSVEKAFFRARRGEIVVREGEVVSEGARRKIEALNRGHWVGVTLFRSIGLSATLGLFLWLGRWFLLQTSPAFPRDKKTLYIMGTILFVSAGLCNLTLYVGQGLAELFHWYPTVVLYLPPVALGAMLISLIIGARASLPGGSLVVGTLLAFLSSMAANGGLTLFIYFLIGSMVGAFSLRSCRRRFDVLGTGLRIGFAQAVAMPLVEAVSGNMLSWTWLSGMTIAMASGLLVGLLGLALIPMLEWLFNLTTDSRLLELASGDHPLLKRLSLRTPGTYHHSVMMGNLAEAAAEAIDANPLMARVMALYHDIGKLSKPHYFVENQSGENRHDNLSPSMSAKIIMSHVKDGVEMAREYHLGAPILEAITTHQGNSLLQYFYNKALKDATRRGEVVPESEYRYPGPKPQSRESGILMLADSVEAAARTLKNPSPSKIQNLVQRIVNNKIADKQLDECKLTLSEIATIEEAFCRVLILGFYHHRIAYPDQIKKPPPPPGNRSA